MMPIQLQKQQEVAPHQPFLTQQPSEKNMGFLKNIALFTAKTFCLLALLSWFLVSPIQGGITKAIDGFNQNVLVKIISYDMISNPLTFIRMAQYYIDKEKYEQAELCIEYAQTLMSAHPYPNFVSALVADLNKKIPSSFKKD